ncbi:hypothetical protein NDU88_001017 [Pleurodeles waltl]|uniref:Uncharacterized protein n=1 Tax=Pleurodeles waltl TaxID=8319 RepID=A0AAV7LZU5_PLEWA|nr:hypothetical protein NDU88_001017 [Pleurodeles waltl]
MFLPWHYTAMHAMHHNIMIRATSPAATSTGIGVHSQSEAPGRPPPHVRVADISACGALGGADTARLAGDRTIQRAAHPDSHTGCSVVIGGSAGSDTVERR